MTADEEFTRWFSKRITSMLGKDVLEKALPNIIGDCKRRLDEMGDAGVTDPFESIYSIVFQLTMRIVGANEIAEDRKLMNKVEHYYAAIDDSANTWNIIFPSLPTWSLIKRYYSGARIYMIFQNIIKRREKQGRREDDPLQFMLDKGDSLDHVIRFVIGSLFAGELVCLCQLESAKFSSTIIQGFLILVCIQQSVSFYTDFFMWTGINAGYVFCYLALDNEWRIRCYKELEDLANRFAPNPALPLYEKLDSIPINAWENDLPSMDLVLRESIRLNLPGAAIVSLC